ncbi:MAG: hypothetical protein LBT51_09150 [Fusobacteriaceae bacterium]|jgi:hypothetical protein|nr:hypothetical protein [Fusobacteriaceae bacterium]
MNKLIVIFLFLFAIKIYPISASQALLQLKDTQTTTITTADEQSATEYRSLYKDSVEFTTNLLFEKQEEDPYSFGMIVVLSETPYNEFRKIQLKITDNQNTTATWDDTWSLRRESMYDTFRERNYTYDYVLPPLEGQLYEDYGMTINTVLILFTAKNQYSYEATQKVLKKCILLLVADASGVYDVAERYTIQHELRTAIQEMIKYEDLELIYYGD